MTTAVGERGEGSEMGVDRAVLTSTDAGSDPMGRGFRAFGRLRRQEPPDAAAEPGDEEPREELRYTLDPDVARRIALYVGQEPSDTDLEQILGS